MATAKLRALQCEILKICMMIELWKVLRHILKKMVIMQNVLMCVIVWCLVTNICTTSSMCNYKICKVWSFGNLKHTVSVLSHIDNVVLLSAYR